VLAAPAAIVAAPAGATPRAKLGLAARGGTSVMLELLGGNLVRRDGEPIALQLSTGAYDRLARTAPAYADSSVWNEEPTTITSIEIDDITYARGAVIGEWTRVPAGAFDPKRVEAVVAALASPRRSPDMASISATHRVVLTVTPPVGAPVTHEVNVAGGRCLATSATATIKLARAVCDALDALAR
jgi:hypothetical protein